MPAEKSGAGANGYTYYVCSFLGGPLTRLPAVKPAQIKAARQIKKFVTGKLDSQVATTLHACRLSLLMPASTATASCLVLHEMLIIADVLGTTHAGLNATDPFTMTALYP